MQGFTYARQGLYYWAASSVHLPFPPFLLFLLAFVIWIESKSLCMQIMHSVNELYCPLTNFLKSSLVWWWFVRRKYVQICIILKILQLSCMQWVERIKHACETVFHTYFLGFYNKWIKHYYCHCIAGKEKLEGKLLKATELISRKLQ